MTQKITEGVNIKVETFYREEQSSPEDENYFFNYKITIENLGNMPIQLLSRYWFIQDSVGVNQEVQGEGVIGIQPILIPDETYQYVSAVSLRSDIGKMSGKYIMKNLQTNKTFEVAIPEFELMAPFRMN